MNSNTEPDYYILTSCFSIRFTFDSHCPDRLRRLVNEGKIVQYLDDMEMKVSEAITRQVELWKKTDNYYQTALLAGDKKEIIGLENCFENMAREIIFESMIYI